MGSTKLNTAEEIESFFFPPVYLNSMDSISYIIHSDHSFWAMIYFSWKKANNIKFQYCVC